MRLPVSLVATLATLAAAGTAQAATLYVPLDRSVRVSVPGSAASVVIGNPAVADVTVVDSHTLFVSGHGYGATDLQVLDAGGRMLVSTSVMVSPPDTGHVSVYRGAARTDLACSPGCQTSTRVGQPAVGVGGGGAGGGIGADLANVVNATSQMIGGRPASPG